MCLNCIILYRAYRQYIFYSREDGYSNYSYLGILEFFEYLNLNAGMKNLYHRCMVCTFPTKSLIRSEFSTSYYKTLKINNY